MLARLEPNQQVETLILDFVDAFWNVPLAPSERRYFVGKVRKRFYVYVRAAQGSRNGPLSWAAVISVVLRLTQGMYVHDTIPPALVMQTFVDDPCVTTRGSTEERHMNHAVLVLAWRVLGLSLAFHKA